MMVDRARERLRALAVGVFLGVSGIVFLGPVLWVFLTALKTPRVALADPPVLVFRPTLMNYRALFLERSEFWLYLWNSVVVAVITTGIVMVIGSMAAYGFVRFRYKGGNALMMSVLATRMLPRITLLIPLYILMLSWGLLDTRVGLIIASVPLFLPFAIWLMQGFILGVDTDLEEAAVVDGCSRIGAFWRITVPLMAPGLAATGIFSMIGTWNEYLVPLVLTSRNAVTLPVFTAGFVTDAGISWTVLCASASVMFVPVMGAALFIQRYVVSGLSAGALKG